MANTVGLGDKLITAVSPKINAKTSTAAMKKTADSILPSAQISGVNKAMEWENTSTIKPAETGKFYTGGEAFGNTWYNTKPLDTTLPKETKVYTTDNTTVGTVDTGETGGPGTDTDGTTPPPNNYRPTGTGAGGTTKTAAKTGTGNVSPYTLQSYQAQTDAINQLYDAQKEAQIQALENAYNLSREEAEYAASKIPEQYQAQANQVDTRALQARQNFNEWAAGQGLNVGTGSQAALAMSNQRNSDIAAINRAQAEAQEAAQRNLATMQQQYQNAVAEAISKNQYDRAAALLSEYQAAAKSAVDTANAQAQLDYQAKVNYAKTLASAGDYSGYKALGYTNADIAKLRSATRRSGGTRSTTASATPAAGNDANTKIDQLLSSGVDRNTIAATIQTDPNITDKVAALTYLQSK